MLNKGYKIEQLSYITILCFLTLLRQQTSHTGFLGYNYLNIRKCNNFEAQKVIVTLLLKGFLVKVDIIIKMIRNVTKQISSVVKPTAFSTYKVKGSQPFRMVTP